MRKSDIVANPANFHEHFLHKNNYGFMTSIQRKRNNPYNGKNSPHLLQSKPISFDLQGRLWFQLLGVQNVLCLLPIFQMATSSKELSTATCWGNYVRLSRSKVRKKLTKVSLFHYRIFQHTSLLVSCLLCVSVSLNWFLTPTTLMICLCSSIVDDFFFPTG